MHNDVELVWNGIVQSTPQDRPFEVKIWVNNKSGHQGYRVHQWGLRGKSPSGLCWRSVVNSSGGMVIGAHQRRLLNFVIFSPWDVGSWKMDPFVMVSPVDSSLSHPLRVDANFDCPVNVQQGPTIRILFSRSLAFNDRDFGDAIAIHLKRRNIDSHTVGIPSRVESNMVISEVKNEMNKAQGVIVLATQRFVDEMGTRHTFEWAQAEAAAAMVETKPALILRDQKVTLTGVLKSLVDSNDAGVIDVRFNDRNHFLSRAEQAIRTFRANAIQYNRAEFAERMKLIGMGMFVEWARERIDL